MLYLVHAWTRVKGSRMSKPSEAMTTAGRRPDADMLVDVDRLVGAYYDEHPDPSDPAAGGVVRDLGSPWQLARAGRSPRITSSRSARRSRATGRPKGSTARCSSGATRTRCPSRRSGPRSRCSSRTGSTSPSTPTDGYTPTPAISHAILTHNAGAEREGRRDRDHAVAQPARGRRLQVQPAARRAGRHGRHAGRSRTPPTSCCANASAAFSGSATSEAITRARRYDYRSAYVDDLAAVVAIDEIARRRAQARRRPARRRERRVLGRDREPLRARPRGRQRPGRPDVLVHAARPRRQDPDGLLLAVTRWPA